MPLHLAFSHCFIVQYFAEFITLRDIIIAHFYRFAIGFLKKTEKMNFYVPFAACFFDLERQNCK